MKKFDKKDGLYFCRLSNMNQTVLKYVRNKARKEDLFSSSSKQIG